MTNDITTLNGSLQELGETMAANLVTMGVSDAQASDGLTTLAGKILDIPVTPVTKLLTVTSTKDILSYADSDTCTFTATYTENGSPVSGKTVTFKAYQNGTLVENIGSDTTDASGEASVSYSSKGAGDLSIECECNLLQETYAIEDCLYYDSLTTDKERYTTISGTPSLTYDSTNGLTVTTSVAQIALVRNNALTLPSNYIAELTITSVGSSSNGTGICFDDFLADRGTSNVVLYKLSNTSQLKANLTRWQTNDVVKFVKNGSSMSYYLNNTLKATVTISDDTHYQHFRTYQNRPTTFKNLKVKPL